MNKGNMCRISLGVMKIRPICSNSCITLRIFYCPLILNVKLLHGVNYNFFFKIIDFC